MAPCAREKNTPWRMPMRQAGGATNSTMRKELFPGASSFITGTRISAWIFWHAYMIYASNCDFPDTALVVFKIATNQMQGAYFLAFIHTFLAFKKCQQCTFFFFCSELQP
jgi:hypothetical protein